MLVVFVHLNVFLPILGLPQFGFGGVDVFFVISGFIMVYTNNSGRNGPVDFIIHRLVRVAPIYWLLTCGVFLLAVIAPGLLGSTRASLFDLVRSIAFIPFRKVNGLTEPILFVGWTLNYEMFFYVIFAVGLAFGRFRYAFTILLMASIIAAGVLLHPVGAAGQFYSNAIIAEFGLGMVIAMAAPYIPQAPSKALKVLVLLLCIWSVLAVILDPQMPDAPRLLAVGLPSGLLIVGALALDRWGWTASSPFLVAIGDASYSIYLTHPFVTQTLQKASSHLQQGRLVTWGMTLLTLGSVAGVGLLFFRWVEKPLTAYLRRILIARAPPSKHGAFKPAA